MICSVSAGDHPTAGPGMVGGRPGRPVAGDHCLGMVRFDSGKLAAEHCGVSPAAIAQNIKQPRKLLAEVKWRHATEMDMQQLPNEDAMRSLLHGDDVRQQPRNCVQLLATPADGSGEPRCFTRGFAEVAQVLGVEPSSARRGVVQAIANGTVYRDCEWKYAS